MAMRNYAVAAAALLAGAAMLGAAGNLARAADVQVGTLNCNVEGGWGYIIGSKKDLRCTFSPAEGTGVEHYKGSITKIGADIGYTSGGVILWAVFAPSRDVSAGALAGRYAGATAEALNHSVIAKSSATPTSAFTSSTVP